MFEHDSVVYYLSVIYQFVHRQIPLDHIEVSVKESSLYGPK